MGALWELSGSSLGALWELSGSSLGARCSCGYRTMPANASRGKNVLRRSKKVSMTATDHINQQAVASYVREAIFLNLGHALKSMIRNKLIMGLFTCLMGRSPTVLALNC
jgi:hypothetical protein